MDPASGICLKCTLKRLNVVGSPYRQVWSARKPSMHYWGGKIRFFIMKKEVFITGATGVMGKATLDEILNRGDCKVRLLVRPGKKNRKLLKKYISREDVEIIWGDLLDPGAVRSALGNATIVIHMGGMVSPMADDYPEKTLKVNVGGTRNIVEAVKAREDKDEVRLIYIGSVAQISDRMEPLHWGRAGDPVMASKYDYYGISKIMAEREVAESGLKRWVSLRQTGILHPGLFLRGSNPITFHVPLKGVLEWATVEDSAHLMSALCNDSIPDSFWRNFYNIGSGEEYRLTNYEFEKLILGAVGSPAPEKIFEPNWFATRNFHGCWFSDSDRLNELIPFRENIPVKEYFTKMVRKAPLWVKAAPLAPAPLVKRMMRKVASTPDKGTLDWVSRNDCEDKINAYFGSREERERIPGWEGFDLTRPTTDILKLSHGYDEGKPETELDLEDCIEAATFRGGECLAGTMKKGDLDTRLEWRCAYGHKFSATPRIVFKGGHWCPECMPAPWRYEEEAEVNPFIAQVVRK